MNDLLRIVFGFALVVLSITISDKYIVTATVIYVAYVTYKELKRG